MKLYIALLALSFSVSLYSMSFNDQLLEACKTNNYTQVEEILTHAQHDIININTSDTSGYTPLHHAVSCNNEKLVGLLINNGANANVKSNDNWTPLHGAAHYGSTHMVELLLQNDADSTAKSKHGTTPLHSAARNGHVQSIELLIKNSAKINDKDNSGHTPLHDAVRNGHVQSIELLLKNGADVNARNNYNRTPLSYVNIENVEADEKLAESIITLLIKYGADINALQGHSSDYMLTTLHLAIANNKDTLAMLLIKHGADLTITDSYGTSALDLAANPNHPNRLKLLSSIIQSKHVNINADYPRGILLHRAAIEGSMPMVKLLLSQGADETKQTANGNSALALARNAGHAAIAQLLENYEQSQATPKLELEDYTSFSY